MTTPAEDMHDGPNRLALRLALFLVLVGMLHNLPAIPGLDQLARTLSGNPDIVVRKFSYQYFYPLVFVLMMIIVGLSCSQWRAAADRGRSARIVGLSLDIALVVAAFGLATAYLTEIDSVCLIDQLNGTRAALMEKSLADAKDFALLYGLPEPTTVDDPPCVATLGNWIFPVVVGATAVFLIYNARVWGLPLVLVALVMASYAVMTAVVWYVFGSDGISKYLVTKLGDEDTRSLLDARPNVQNVLTSSAQGFLGRFLAVMLDNVYPYIVLGSLFGVSAGGRALIKLAILLTRNLRGGPGHAAIVSSALFGTISGGPVVNVLSTGTLTIPMMVRRGFGRTFAGGIEAAASSGGQIMPPVMGVAAFILAAMTTVPYREVIVAATLPAIAYFGCLFLTVVFQARKLNMQPVGEISPEMRLTREDKLHLLMIFAPLLLILFLLITPKDAIGCGPIAGLLGVPRIIDANGCQATSLPWLFRLVQNSAGDAGSAGWWATALLTCLFFLDKEVRQAPSRILHALADAGITISRLYLMFLAVSVIDFSLNFTGLPSYLTIDLITLMDGLGGTIGQSPVFLLIGLTVTMLIAIVLGMGMPTAPAYINVALLLGPMLAGLGIATFTANLFIFYFAVASAITPPVAIAAMAGAQIAKSDPIATGLSAVKSGIVIFVIPFIFAFYPEILLIDAAQLDPAGGGGTYLAGYTGSIALLPLIWTCARIAAALYFLSSALARYDRRPLSRAEALGRVILAVLVLFHTPYVYGPALIVMAVLSMAPFGRTRLA